MKILAQVLRDDTNFQTELTLVAGEAGLSHEIRSRRVQKPGLAIAGFTKSIRPDHVQVLGRTEMGYLGSLEPKGRQEAMEGLLSTGLTCIIVTSGIEVPTALITLAESRGVAVFRSPLYSGELIARVHALLEEHLSPEISVHGVLVDVFGIGVLLTGPSGVGKSECALDLVQRGHRLTADDVVIIKQKGRSLHGMGSSLTRHHMEVRGLGIINVKDLFGAAAVREQKHIELIVNLLEWEPGVAYDRTGLDEQTESILEVDVPAIRLPLRPGRNVASIVEVAARNHLLKLQGHHSAREFQSRVEHRLAAGATEDGLS